MSDEAEKLAVKLTHPLLPEVTKEFALQAAALIRAQAAEVERLEMENATLKMHAEARRMKMHVEARRILKREFR